MSAQFKVALLRALGLGTLSAASTALSIWTSLPSPMTSGSGKSLIAGSASAFLAPFLARWGAEGYYDTRRAQEGKVQASDVTPLRRAA